MVWPEGNENWSGGKSLAQQWGSISQGRRRPERFLIALKSPTPIRAADPAEATAVRRLAPPKSMTASPVRYHSQPSPARVATIAQSRIHLGADHLFTLRISLRSRAAIN